MDGLKYKPVGFWKGDSSPVTDFSGYARNGTISGTAKRGLSVSADAVYSQLFDKSTTGAFPCPVYVAGRESNSFTLAASVYPVARTEGVEPQPYRENLSLNPIGVSSGPNYEYFQRWGWSVSWTTNGSGSPIGNTNWATLTSPASIQTAVTTRGLDMYTNHDTTPATNTAAKSQPVAVGEPITVSVWVRPSIATTFRVTTRIHDGNGVWLDAVTYTGDNISTPDNVWSRVSLSFVPQYTGFLAVGVRSNTTQDWPANSTIDVTGILIEKTSTLNAYFDGNIPGHEWMGTPNQSGSRTMKGVHRVNLAGAITHGNTGTDENGINALDPTNGVVNRGFSWNGSTWLKFTWNGTGNRILRQMARRIDLLSGEHYTVTATFGNDGASPVEVLMDWTDSFQKTVTVPAGGTVTVSTGGIRPGGYNNIYRFADFEPTVASSFLIKDIIIEHTSTSKPFFNGNTAGATWSGTVGTSPSLMLVSNGEQKILSGQSYDGLSINGNELSFSTRYSDGTEAKAVYELDTKKKVNVVGVHTSSKNSLYVDGVLVDEVDINEVQQTLSYESAGGTLYSGGSDSSQGILVNSVGAYPRALQPEEIKRLHERLNRRAPGEVPKMYGGEDIFISSDVRSPYLNVSWTNDADWNSAVMVGTVADLDQLICTKQDGVTLGGTWTDSIDLYVGETPEPINSISAFWEGENETVYASVDGDSWTQIYSGRNISIIPTGFDPTGKALHIRVQFPAGVDEAFIDNLRIRGYVGNTAVSSNRTITYTNPVVMYDEYTPAEMNDHWGVRLDGGTVDIAPDVLSDAPLIPKAVEVWIKPLSDNSPVFSSNLLTGATVYTNGVAGSTYRVGEWSVVHLVGAADIVGNINISGNVQIGKVAVYDTALSAATVASIVRQYTGVDSSNSGSAGTITIAEPATSAKIYAHDWEITAS